MNNPLNTARDCISNWATSIMQQQQYVELLDAPEDVRAACRIIADAANSSDEHESKAAIRCLFADLVEVWNDSFHISGRNIYARLFAHIVWHSAQNDSELLQGLHKHGITDEQALLQRHYALRQSAENAPATAQSIVILSRVTIGADILLSTVLIQHVQEKYPDAHITLIGDKKIAGLFGGFKNLSIHGISYARRGTLQDRLRSWLDLDVIIEELQADLIIAPDSRLDQLGIMPFAATTPYLLWENTQPNDSTHSLSLLLDQWCQKTFFHAIHTSHTSHTTSHVPAIQFDTAHAHTAQQIQQLSSGLKIAAVKLDYGGNADKSLPRAQEIQVLQNLRDKGWHILIDRGFGDEELANSDQLMQELGWTPYDICDKANDTGTNKGTAFADLSATDFAENPVIRFYGSIASWAACVSACQLALSYDSVGHHMAAALGVPVIIAFTGYQDPAFPIAWQPRGENTISMHCIPMDEKNTAAEKIITDIPQALLQ